MKIFSRFRARQQETEPVEAAPRATREAVERALRGTSRHNGSVSAAELGQRIATSLSTVETAVLAIDAVSDLLREAADLASDAARSDDPGRRALLAGRYDDLRSEIDAIVGSASHNRINLIAGRRSPRHPASFEITLDMEGRRGIALPIVNLTTSTEGLSLSPPRSAFEFDEEIDMILCEIDRARDVTENAAACLADHAALVAERIETLRCEAGERRIDSNVPTGADTPEDEVPIGEGDETARDETPPAPDAMDENMSVVEDKLQALAERLNRRVSEAADRAAQQQDEAAGNDDDLMPAPADPDEKD
ncbi:hypothetical protein FHS78_000568 [Parvibaculum indicum]|uniref:hypothetical protein n=1 Tax=Parvibaculum indicum TaxID=562969 RepID=UPI00141EED7E|nr:hypothetical protein [Parvibaculum indicum]NIJ40298.1 hypothetical protein [Parvibaculum indicum]